ncbi:hypothetical protein V6N13_005393 [Hibiscus sabdariffa]|uniref:TF-B3 domain-containing protein n=1 Tax=Hibiscus sabdariffa TaxID=183260 RepID=A0ABR2ETD8_9ROSI
MAEIETVHLASHHEARWRFCDRSRTLPDGWIILTVTDGCEWWRFECKSVGDDMYCISGSEWRRFFRRVRINATVTLYSRADDENFHRVRVKLSEV